MTIQFSLGGLSFVLFDNAARSVSDMEFHQSDSLNSADELFRVLEKDLNARDLGNLQSVTCMMDGRSHTLVPETLYQPDQKDRLLGFSLTVPNGYLTEADPVPSHQAFLLYAYPEALRNRIRSQWPEDRICHAASVFLESLPQSEAPVVYVNVRNRDFDLAVMQDRLLFFNNFPFQTKVDFSYYLLYAMQQLGLSGLETTVCFTGLIQPSSEIIDLCRRYVKDLRFVSRPAGFKVKASLAEVPFQYYYNHYQILK